MKQLLILLPVIILLQACTISKRRYSNGFYISFRSGPVELKTKSKASPGTRITSWENVPEACAQTGFRELVSGPVLPALSFETGEDTLVFLNGARVCAHISSIEPQVVLYKDCSPSAEAMSVPRSMLHKIIYANGNSEILNVQVVEPRQQVYAEVPVYDTESMEDSKKKNFLAIFLSVGAMLLFLLGIGYYSALFFVGIAVMVAAFVFGSLAQKTMRRNEELRKPAAALWITALMIVLPIFFFVTALAFLGR